MLRTMVLSFVYSPTVELSELMSAFGKIVKLNFCLVLVPKRCLADTIRPPEISVFFMVSDRCLTTRVRGYSQVVLGGCWENLVSFGMHSDRQFICFLDCLRLHL